MKKYCLAAGLLAPFISIAGSIGPGKISDISPLNTGVVVINMASGAQKPAACSTYPNAMALDANTSGGKAQLATLLAALNSNKTVTLMGASTCTIWGGTENLYYPTVNTQ